MRRFRLGFVNKSGIAVKINSLPEDGSFSSGLSMKVPRQKHES
jgi:hypothetical protein